ncbi:MAG: GNAT family N-acetyltransferase [Bacteroidota bacterium]|nr:GNAT family N-acetyltransferase [Bacteroidota bacterium]MDP3145227.1 GNAT family N-acetyltransferase [Bacteroidota bacterium]
MRIYKCLNTNQFSEGNYTLAPIRDEDKYDILNWRNSQIDILRQQEAITKEQQDYYFDTTIAQLFEQEKPKQLLFSFLLDDKLIGYGGLVHIDWVKKTAEISFLTETSRSQSKEIFISDWINYLSLLKKVADNVLNFNSIFTFAYDIRPNLYIALEASGFKETSRIKQHIKINEEFKDAVIHTFYFKRLQMRLAQLNDIDLYFDWANDTLVRSNSYNNEKIEYTQHVNWFKNKLNSNNCFFYLFLNETNPIGQVRIENLDNEIIIGISIDKKYRGKGFGVEMLEQASENYLNQNPTKEITAYIKTENTASINLFTKAGFIKTDSVVQNGFKSFKFKKTKDK